MDQDIRKLQRLAEQGDTEARRKLVAHEVRLRGFPLGPWDDPEWFAQFEQAVRHLRYNLNEGESYYASSTHGFISVEEVVRRRRQGEAYPRGPVDGQVTRIRSSSINAATMALEVKARGILWLDYQTITQGRSHNYHVEGFWVTFGGDPGFLWTSCYTPFDNRIEAKSEILAISSKRKLPVAEAFVESRDPLRIVLRPFILERY